MNLFARIWNVLKAIAGVFVTRFEDSVDPAVLLAQERKKDSDKFERQLDRATNIGEIAEEMARKLAEQQVAVEMLRKSVKSHVVAAQKAKQAGDDATAQAEMQQAAMKANELSAAQEDLAEWKETVDEALQNKQAARQMVYDRANVLAMQELRDDRTVAQIEFAKMRGQATQDMESLLSFKEGETSDVRARLVRKARKDSVRATERQQIVQELLRRQGASRVVETTTSADMILDEIKAEVGFTDAPASALTEDLSAMTKEV